MYFLLISTYFLLTNKLINVIHIPFIPLQLCRECSRKADAILLAKVVLPGMMTFTFQDENNEKLILLPLVAKGKKIFLDRWVLLHFRKMHFCFHRRETHRHLQISGRVNPG